MEIIFRQLGANDLKVYREIRLECLKNYPENFGSTFEEESLDDSLLLDKILARKGNSEFMIGAFSSNNLIGICGFRQEGRRKTNHRGEIVQMYVRPGYSGKGVGSRLLKSALRQAFGNPEINLVTLGVVSHNVAALNLYRSFGFQEYGKLDNSFKDKKGWTQLLMVLSREHFTE